MEFLYPGFLYALAALAIPVIIHLFNFRRFKKIPFTNVRFLREIKQQTQSQNKLRHLLVLLMRLLAITFLVLAFAQPFLPSGDSQAKTSRKSVSVFIDNSFSMEGESQAGMMLEVAKNRAIDIAQAYEPTDRFQLLSQDFEGKHQRFVGRQEFIEWVQELEPSPQSKSLDEIATRQKDQLKSSDGENAKLSYIVSDFQKSRFDFDQFQSDTAVAFSLVHLERNTPNNVYIDSVWFASPVRKLGENEQILARIINSGDADAESIPVKLFVNGRQKAIGTATVGQGASAVATLNYVHDEPGIQRAEVQIEDYPVTYDDSFFFAYTVFEEIKILSIRDGNLSSNDFLKAVYASDSTYRYTAVQVGNVSYSELGQYNLIVLDELNNVPSGLAGAIENFAKNGGSVWIIPPKNVDPDTYNTLLQALDAGALLNTVKGENKVNSINADHPLYQGIFEKLPSNPDLPTASTYVKVSNPLRAEADVLMGFRNGDAFLTGYRTERGKLYLLAVPLSADDNNFSRHALFVATALRIAELSQTTGIQAILLDSDAFFTIPPVSFSNESVFHLVSSEKEIDVIPRYQLRDGQLDITPGPDVYAAGNYLLLLGNDTIAAAGLNYKREESDLESYTAEELKAAVAGKSISIFDGNSSQLGREIVQQTKGTELWKICLILVLFFLLLESVLLRFWKKQAQ